MPSSHILQFIAGLAFFFLGLYSTHEGLETYAGDRFKSMIARTTRGRFRCLLTGIGVTFFLQSSSAVTVMTVALASSGLLTLEQAMSVALGAGIGTTFVVLLISVRAIVDYGVVILVSGLLLRFLADRKVVRAIGEILFGLGFIFLGLNVMAQATIPLKTYPWIPTIFEFMYHYPLANFVIAAVVTALVHSSGVVLGILVSLAYSGSITFESAFPMVLGANVGTAFTAITAAIKSNVEGKRVAWANLILRVGAVIVIAPFIPFCVSLLHQLHLLVVEGMMGWTLTVNAEIALSHFFFNVFVALIFLPFISFGEKLVCWFIPQKLENQPFGPKYLDPSSLATPSLAFAQISRELVRMADIALGMLRDSLMVLKKYNLDIEDDISSRDHKVDVLYKAIKLYLAKLSFSKLDEKEVAISLHLMNAANELENIGDTIERELMRLARVKWSKNLEFSKTGWLEICEMYKATEDMLVLATACLSSFNEELALQIKHHEQFYNERMDPLKKTHLFRLHDGLKETLDTSSIHLELMSFLRQIHLSLLSMVEYLIPEKKG
ncbi:MAG: hypothetical protein A2048_08640 [Deltaproteobacteria bacterium GWA2_45_12]|nr:MAG: hypothetical protein A2048_08640 [Deltaproteobacteria bacterium GWA2_45_12]